MFSSILFQFFFISHSGPQWTPNCSTLLCAQEHRLRKIQLLFVSISITYKNNTDTFDFFQTLKIPLRDKIFQKFIINDQLKQNFKNVKSKKRKNQKDLRNILDLEALAYFSSTLQDKFSKVHKQYFTVLREQTQDNIIPVYYVME